MTLRKKSNKKKITSIKAKQIKVSTDKKAVATVKVVKKSGKATGFKVTAKKAGKATITIKVKKGTYKGSYKCKVTVKAKSGGKTQATANPVQTLKPNTQVTQAPTGTSTPAPGDKTPAPGDKTPAPGDKTPAPGDNTPAPGDNTPAPGDNTPAPGDNTPAPGDNTPAPGDETPAPGDETPAPGDETPAPVEKAVLSITITDADEKPLTGTTVKLLKDTTVVAEATLANDKSICEVQELENGTYTVQVSKAGYEDAEKTVEVKGTGKVETSVALKKDETAPTVSDYDFTDKGEAIVLIMSEAVQVKENSVASVTVTGADETSIALAAPQISEDGMKVTLRPTTGNSLADGVYLISALNNITDKSGHAVAFEKAYEVTKKTEYTDVKINSTGFAAEANQKVSYTITDNYGKTYESRDVDANADMVSALGLDVALYDNGTKENPTTKTPVVGTAANTFNLAGMKDHILDVEVNLSKVTTIKGDNPAKAQVTVGDVAKASSISKLVTTAVASGSLHTADYVPATDIVGTAAAPIVFKTAPASSKEYRIYADLLDQYQGAYGVGKVTVPANNVSMTFVSSDKDVIALKGINTSGTADLTSAKTVKSVNHSYVEFETGKIGKATITAYLIVNNETVGTATCEIEVVKPTLTGVTVDDQTAGKVIKAGEEKTVATDQFHFVYGTNPVDAYKTPKSDLDLKFVSAVATTDTKPAESNVLTSEVLENANGEFNGIKFKFDKVGTYTFKLSSKNNNQSDEFDVTVDEDTTITNFEVVDKDGKAVTSLKLKKGGETKTVSLKFKNRYDRVVTGPAKQNFFENTTIMKAFALFEGSNEVASKIGDNTEDVKYALLKADGSAASADADVVAGFSLTYQGAETKAFKLRLALNGKDVQQDITLNTSVATVSKIELATKEISKAGELVVKDSTKKYIPLKITDQDGDPMPKVDVTEFANISTSADEPIAYTSGLKILKDTDPTNAVNPSGFMAIVYVKADGTTTTADPDEAAGMALEINPAGLTANNQAGLYNVQIAHTKATKITKTTVAKYTFGEIRKLNEVKASIDGASKVTLTKGSTGAADVTANIELRDQYGKLMDEDVTGTAAPVDVVSLANSGTATKADTGKYTLVITAAKPGTAKITLSATHDSADNGTDADITKTAELNVTVIAYDAVTKINVKNDASKNELLLRQTNFGAADATTAEIKKATWSTVALSLEGIAADGSKVVVDPQDYEYVIKDNTAAPNYITFNKATGTFSVNTTNLDLADSTPESAKLEYTITEPGKGTALGTFTLEFKKALPVPASISAKEDGSSADEKPLELVVGTKKDISGKKLTVVTDNGDTVTDTIKNLKIKDLICTNVGVTVAVAEENAGTSDWAITADATVPAGTVLTFVGNYTKNGKTLTLRFTGKVKAAS